MAGFLSLDELFEGRHFDREIIVLCVRWYLRFKLSFRDLVEMMAERGLSMAHTTIMRWVHHYAPEFERRWNRFARPAGSSWRVDETVLVQIKSKPTPTFDRAHFTGSGANKVQANADLRQGSFYAAASTAFQTAGVLPPLRRSLPRLNCPLWIRRSSSTPAIVIVAVLNCLKPSIGPMRSLTPRWSCSIRLFRYFDERSFVSAAS